MAALTTLSALLGFLSVALGAFGAHALDGRLSPDARGWWETATLYAMVHAAAVLAIALSGRSGTIHTAGWVMLAGATLFAATLYAMALGAPRWFGAITPLGGLGMLSGWGLMAWAGLRHAQG